MKYYSTNGQAPVADLEKAVVKGLAEDRGLYMPESIYKLPSAFFDHIGEMAFQDIAYNVASNFFGDEVLVRVIFVITAMSGVNAIYSPDSTVEIRISYAEVYRFFRRRRVPNEETHFIVICGKYCLYSVVVSAF